MASLDISPEIGRSYQKIVSGSIPNKPSPTYAHWAVFSVSAPLQNAFVQSSTSKASTLKVHTAGEGELEILLEEFNDGKVQFAFVKVKDPNSGLPKFVLICWCGEGVPERVKGYFTGHLNAVTKVLHGYHVQVTARSESDLSPESIIQKVADASGAKYTLSPAASLPAPKPTVATKPVFQPTCVTGKTLPVGSRAPYRRNDNVDADGWGEDAPQITRSQLEKVPSAYKPTKVDINELRAQPSSTTSGFSKTVDDGDIIRGGYQPIGKVDIAALRKGYKEERPEPVKGSYQPVDVSSIKKGRPEPEPLPQKSAVERSGAFSQSERLMSLPKPKAAKKFGPGAPSFGTKPLTPGGFGASPSAPPPVQVGSINKTGSTKSPAQLWAEKKARERGDSEVILPSVSPVQSGRNISPAATGSSYHEEEVSTPSGGISALRNIFSGTVPTGAPTPQQVVGRKQASPPPPPTVDTSTRPSFGAPIPVFPSREPEPEALNDELPSRHIPGQPVQPPRSPSPPTPEIPSSPVRIAMPVARHDIEPENLVTKPVEPTTSLPTKSIEEVVPKEEELTDEPSDYGGTAKGGSHKGSLRAVVLYDYTADEENEIHLQEGQVITNIEMVDEDWWSGTNSQGHEGLFPSNYVELIEQSIVEKETAPPPSHSDSQPKPEPVEEKSQSLPSAVAIYDYEAAEDNELSFPEGAIIENIQFPDEDWWYGTYNGKEGLFPSNYVEMQE